MATDRRSVSDTRQSLANPDYKGEDYAIDPEIEKGPQTNRRCTDLICLLIFLIAVGFSGYVAIYALEHGDPERIMAPMDGNGNFCGKTEGYEDYPYLFFSDLNIILWAPYAVCVKTCPQRADTGYPKFYCKGTTNVPADANG